MILAVVSSLLMCGLTETINGFLVISINYMRSLNLEFKYLTAKQIIIPNEQNSFEFNHGFTCDFARRMS